MTNHSSATQGACGALSRYPSASRGAISAAVCGAQIPRTRREEREGERATMLQQLERLGLVEIHRGGPRVGTIHSASPDLIAHLFDLSSALDPALVGQWLDVAEILFTGAVRLALERASDPEFARARELLRALVAS